MNYVRTFRYGGGSGEFLSELYHLRSHKHDIIELTAYYITTQP